MTTSPDREAVKAADEATDRLKEAGFPATAIQSWWMLLTDPEVNMTPHRVWESRDFATLGHLVDKTVRSRDAYRSELERITSEHWAERLAQSEAVKDRLLGGLAL